LNLFWLTIGYIFGGCALGVLLFSIYIVIIILYLVIKKKDDKVDKINISSKIYFIFAIIGTIIFYYM
jgi:hypothetical protein